LSVIRGDGLRHACFDVTNKKRVQVLRQSPLPRPYNQKVITKKDFFTPSKTAILNNS
jgi:hypothetical protein